MGEIPLNIDVKHMGWCLCYYVKNCVIGLILVLLCCYICFTSFPMENFAQNV